MFGGSGERWHAVLKLADGGSRKAALEKTEKTVWPGDVVKPGRVIDIEENLN